MLEHDADIWENQRHKRFLNNVYTYFLNLLHFALDLSPWFIRNVVWKLLLKDCGTGVYFDNRVYVKFPWLVSIGSDVSVNRGVEFYPLLRGRKTVRIGSNVRIAPHVRFHAGGHDPDDTNLAEVGGDIVVGNGAWIGTGAVILPGVAIGENAIVAAGSVVSKDVAPDSVVGGVPARVLRMRSPH